MPLRQREKIQELLRPKGVAGLVRRRGRGERPGIDLLEIADRMLFAGAEEEDEGNEDECRPNFHEAGKATGERRAVKAEEIDD